MPGFWSWVFAVAPRKLASPLQGFPKPPGAARPLDVERPLPRIPPSPRVLAAPTPAPGVTPMPGVILAAPDSTLLDDVRIVKSPAGSVAAVAGIYRPFGV